VVKRKKKSKKMVFIDVPQILNGHSRLDFNELARSLRSDFDEVRAYARFPERFNGDTPEELPKILHALAKAGFLPMMCPADVDPIIDAEIHKVINERNDIEEIALLSGDNGYFLALEAAKKAGIKTKVIIPNGNSSKLLTSIADEVVGVEEYSAEYNNTVAPWLNEIGSSKESQGIVERQAGVMCE